MKNDLTKIFIDLIKINETSGNEIQIVEYIKSFLKKNKIRTKIDSFGNLIGYSNGVGEPIMLNTHMDIPESMKNYNFKIKNKIIVADGKSILGADPKSGLAVLLQLIRYIKKYKIKTTPIQFVFTKQEEQGLVGASNLDFSLISAKKGLVLDYSGPCSNIVTKAPTFYRLVIEVIGKTAHVSEPSNGINSLKIACDSISKLKLGFFNNEVTFNIGLLTSGTAANTVPGITLLECDIRSFNNRALKEAVSKIKMTFLSESKRNKAKVIFKDKIGYYNYEIKKDSILIKNLSNALKKLKITPNFITTYGGSDTNIFNKKGVESITIGSGYYNPHQYNEYVNLKDMEKLVHLLVNFTMSVK